MTEPDMTEPDDEPDVAEPDGAGTGNEVVAQFTSQLSTNVVLVLAAGLPTIWPLVLPAVAGGVAWAIAHRWLRDTADRAQRFADTAEATGNQPFEVLQATASESVALRHVLARAARAAVETPDQWTIDRLAECFVSAVSDPARVDEQLLVIETLGSLGPIDIRLLRILDQPGPFEPKMIDNPNEVGDVVDIFDSMMWPKTNIVDADPGLRDGLDTVLGKLQMLGMVAKVDVPDRPTWLVFQLTAFGTRCTDRLADRPPGEAARPLPAFTRLGSGVAGGWEGKFIAEGWDHRLTDLKAALLTALRAEGDRPEWKCQDIVEKAVFNRIWFNEETGGGHDCEKHTPEDAGPGCYRYRRVVYIKQSPPR